MPKRILIMVVALAATVAFTATPSVAETPPASAWSHRQELRVGGLYHTAIDDDTAVITDYRWESGIGRAIVFTRTGGNWVHQQTLVSPDPPPAGRGDGFGYSIDIHGNVIVVGQRHPWFTGGAAHVFEYRNGKWRHAARLGAADGWDVTVWGRFIATSARGAPAYPGAAGKIHIFERLPSGWALSQSFRRGRDGHVGCVFGYRLDMQRTVLVAGDYNSHDPCSPGVHVFRRDGSTWSREQRLRGGSGIGHLEGSVAVWDDTIAVGDPDLTGTDTAHRAKVRIFEWNGSRWVRTRTIRRNTQNFGDAVALHRDTLIVTDTTLQWHWVFTRNGGTWQKVSRFGDPGTARYVGVYDRYLVSGGTGLAAAYRMNL